MKQFIHQQIPSRVAVRSQREYINVALSIGKFLVKKPWQLKMASHYHDEDPDIKIPSAMHEKSSIVAKQWIPQESFYGDKI